MTAAAEPAPTGPRPPLDRRLLRWILVLGIADGILLLVLIFFAFVHRSDSAVHLLGPIHGIGFLILLGLTVRGASDRQWGWWFPAIVLVTAGPLGSIVGDVVLRRQAVAVQPVT